MAKSFTAINKGLGLYDVLTFGKYKNCRVDTIISQNPEYFEWCRINTGMLLSQEVTEAVKIKIEAKVIEQETSDRRNRNAYKKHGIAALFGSYADNPDYDIDYDDAMSLDDVPF